MLAALLLAARALPVDLPFDTAVGGVSWNERLFAAKWLPGVHSCPGKFLPILHNLRENRLLLRFSASSFRPESQEYVLEHCSPWLSDSDIDHWLSLVSTPSRAFYRFFINDTVLTAPFSNGSHIYTRFTFAIGGHGIGVEASSPVKITKQTDPMLMPGFGLNVTFAARFDGAVAIPGPDLLPVVWPLLCFLLFLIPGTLFLVNKGKFITVTQLTDTRTLPKYFANLMFFGFSGVLYLVWLLIVVLFIGLRSWQLSTVLNTAVIAAIVPAALRVTIANVINDILIESDYASYIHLILFFVGVAPMAIAGASNIIFRAFRGPPWHHYPIRFGGNLASFYLVPRAVVLGMVAVLPVPRSWLVRSWDVHQPSAPSIPGLFVYAVAGACISYPILHHLFAWVYAETQLDFSFLLVGVVIFSAFAAFAGLWRTIRRLKSGRLLWQDDHITYQFVTAALLAAQGTTIALWLRGVDILDLNAVAYLAAATGGVCAAVVALGTMGSYFASFLFVYIAIVRPHLSDAEAKETVEGAE
jgi:hypothetical protein